MIPTAYPCVPRSPPCREIRGGTLTLSNSDSVYTSVSVIVLDKSCTVAILKRLELFMSKNVVYVITFTPNLQRAFYYNRKNFSPYNTTIQLLLLLILIIGSYLSLRTLLWYLRVITSLLSVSHANSCSVALQPKPSPILAIATHLLQNLLPHKVMASVDRPSLREWYIHNLLMSY